MGTFDHVWGEEADRSEEGEVTYRHAGSGARAPSGEWVGEAFDAHYIDVYRYLRARVGDMAAEDLAQDAFLIVLANPRLCQGLRDSPRPLLFGVATRLASAYWRQAERRDRAMARSADDGREQSWDTTDSDARLDAGVLGPSLAHALSLLSKTDRDVLLLFALAGLRPAEIAKALRMTAVTVRVRLHRARKRMRSMLPERAQTVPLNGQPAYAFVSERRTSDG